MKRLLFFVFAFIAIGCQAQRYAGKEIIVRDSIWINGHWVKGVTTDTTNISSAGDKEIPSTKLMYDFVQSKAIAGGATDTLPLHDQIVALENLKLDKNDTAGKWQGKGTYLTGVPEDTVTVLSKSGNDFVQAHATLQIHDTLFLGSRNTNVFVRYNNPSNLADKSTVTLASQIESATWDSLHRKIYAIEGSTDSLIIWQIDPVTLAYSKVVASNSIIGGGSPVIITDGVYLYGATYSTAVGSSATLFKIRISDWTIVATNTWSNVTGVHSIGFQHYSTFDEIYMGTSSGYLAKVNPTDLSFTYVYLANWIYAPTDDIVVNKIDESGSYIYLAGEGTPPLSPVKGGVRVDSRDMSITPFSALPSYGLFTDGIHLYNCAISGQIQLFQNFNIDRPLTYTARGYVPNEMFFTSITQYTSQNTKMFFTDWKPSTGTLVRFSIPSVVNLSFSEDKLSLATKEFTRTEAASVKVNALYDEYWRNDSLFFTRGGGQEYFVGKRTMAKNGLQRFGSDSIGLGGSLSQATAINGKGNSLTLDSTTFNGNVHGGSYNSNYSYLSDRAVFSVNNGINYGEYYFRPTSTRLGWGIYPFDPTHYNGMISDATGLQLVTDPSLDIPVIIGPKVNLSHATFMDDAIFHSSTTDITALPGNIYYNSLTNQFRGYRNGAWKNFLMDGDTASGVGTETDPVWIADSSDYYKKTQVDAKLGAKQDTGVVSNIYVSGGGLYNPNDSTIAGHIVSAIDTGFVTPAMKIQWDANTASKFGVNDTVAGEQRVFNANNYGVSIDSAAGVSISKKSGGGNGVGQLLLSDNYSQLTYTNPVSPNNGTLYAADAIASISSTTGAKSSLLQSNGGYVLIQADDSFAIDAPKIVFRNAKPPGEVVQNNGGTSYGNDTLNFVPGNAATLSVTSSGNKTTVSFGMGTYEYNRMFTRQSINPGTGTFSIDVNSGAQIGVLFNSTGARTLAFTSLNPGDIVKLAFNNTSGSTITLTLPSNSFVAGTGSATTVTIPTGRSMLTLSDYDGTYSMFVQQSY